MVEQRHCGKPLRTPQAQLVAQKGEGCVRYDFMNPAKNGTYEHKVTYAKKVSDTMFAASGTYLVHE